MSGMPKTATIPTLAKRGAEAKVRPDVRGKFLFVGDEKFYIRGVTYGPFGPVGSDGEYHDPASVERDFREMTRLGFNAIRTYTIPPAWLLDSAARYGLRVMVGVPWEQHVTFLDDSELTRSIMERVRAGIRSCAGHPAVLCYAIGNEIPASIVRWHGGHRVERFLRALYRAAKEEDPGGLFTYVNYPSTEYLQLPFLDLVCFNVYLESQSPLADYIARLHNLAGERPLLMGEIGLDSRRNGEDAQARMLEQQIRTVFNSGCVGTFIFAWTDEWYRGGFAIQDWDFGLTRRDHTPKPALLATATAWARRVCDPGMPWPTVSVVVCTHNGSRHIAECLSALECLDYPEYEVIVVDDGSTDDTAAIVHQFVVRLIRTENRGLSAARNTGLAAAVGEIIAYIDDDAYPDRDWLKRLAMVFLNMDCAGVGGPNIAPPGASCVAECVAHAPGGPIHVLLADTEAEHIPGCNMAFRKSVLLAIGGFDPQFRAAGDDVDICWRIQEQGWKLGFSPTATVFHHRRGTLRAYWRQQVGYGKAEALLERKFPDKYNAAGHLTWAGRVYNARGLTPLWWRRGRIYQGTWGTAPYQRLYQPAESFLAELALVPEWYIVVSVLGILSLIGLVLKPLMWSIPLFVLAAGSSLLQAALSAANAFTSERAKGFSQRLKAFGVGLSLHLMQPLARLSGRLWYGLHPWRRRGESPMVLPRPSIVPIWSERWRAPEDWLWQLRSRIREEGTIARTGGSYDNWDLEVQGGILAGARTRMVVEEHGASRQMLRFRIWLRCSAFGIMTFAVIVFLTIAAGLDRAWPAAALFAGAGLLIVGRILYESALAMQKLTQAFKIFTTQPDEAKRPNTAAAASKTVAARAVGGSS
jgi:GT2 family glycosyltransferase